MTGSAKGGNDTLTGGDNIGSGSTANYLSGDVGGATTTGTMSDKTSGGDDTLIGGKAIAGHVDNFLVGDAQIMTDSAKGGNDTLIAGTQSGGTVANYMWGDAATMATTTSGGKDTFVFQDNGSSTVGTQNFVEDFSQAQKDKIEFSHVANVASFSDLHIAQVGADTVVNAGADQVTLVAYDNTVHQLTASDFVFA